MKSDAARPFGAHKHDTSRNGTAGKKNATGRSVDHLERRRNGNACPVVRYFVAIRTVVRVLVPIGLKLVRHPFAKETAFVCA